MPSVKFKGVLLSLILGIVLGSVLDPMSWFNKPKASKVELKIEKASGEVKRVERSLNESQLATIAETKALASVILEMKSDELKTNINVLRDEVKHEGKSHHRVIRYLVGALARKEPVAALELAKNSDGVAYDHSLLSAVFSELTVIDYDKAVELQAMVEGEEWQQRARHVTLSALQVSDPERFYELPPEVWNKAYNYEGAFSEWVIRNQGKARAHIESISERKRRILAWKGYYAGLVKEDSEAVITEILKTNDRSEQQDILDHALVELAHHDLDRALGAIESISLDYVKNTVIRDVAYKLAPKDPKKLFYWVTKHAKGEALSRSIAYIMTEIAQRDSQEALDLAAELDDPVLIQRAEIAIASAWAGKDAHALLKWAKQYKEGEVRFHSIERALSNLISEDIEIVFKELEALPQHHRDRIVRRLASDVASRNPQMTFEWAQKHVMGEAQAHVISYTVGEVAKGDPHKALKMTEALGRKSVYERAMASLLQAWAKSDPYALLDWARNNADGELLDKGLQKGIGAMLESDMDAALELLAQMPADLRNKVVVGLHYRIAVKNPEKAFSWVMENISDDQARSRVIPNAIRGAADIDIRKALQLVEGLKGPLYESSMNNIFSVWSGQDPKGMLEWAQKNTHGSVLTKALGEGFRSLLRTDVDAAFELATQLPAGMRDDIFRSYSYKMASTDPEKTFMYAHQYATGDAQRDLIQNSMRNLAKQDPERALEMAALLDGTALHSDALKKIAYAWAKKDPHALLKWAQSNADNDVLQYSMSEGFEQLVSKDFNAAMRFVGDLPNTSMRHKMLSGAIYRMVEKDPQRTYEWALENTWGDVQSNAIYRSVGKVAEQDISRALSMVEDLAQNSIYQNAMSSVTSAWAEKDPNGLLEWLDNNASGEVLNAGRQHAYSALANKDIDAAMLLAEQMEPGEARNALADKILYRQVKRLEPLAALQWADTAPYLDDGVRSRAKQTAYREWINRDTMEALAFIESNEPESLKNYASNIVSKWSQWDAKAAVQWANTIEDERTQVRAVGNAINNWIDHDPEGAAEWIDALPAGNVQDEAISKYAYKIKRLDPQLAAEWASTIADTNKRRYSLRSALYEWKKFDSQAAFDFLSGLDLEESELKRLRSSLGR